MLSRFYFHHRPAAAKGGGLGEPGPEESICHLGNCIDASSIEDSWWLLSLLRCCKAITVHPIMRRDYLDPGSLMLVISCVNMSETLSTMTATHMETQETAHNLKRKFTGPGNTLHPVSADTASCIWKANPKSCHQPVAVIDNSWW